MFEASDVAAPLHEELARLRTDGSNLSIAELVDIVQQCQSVANTASAVQTLAMAHLAAIEDVELEDGTVVEQHRGLGHQRLDAPALVSEQLGVSDAGASSRMTVAVEVVTRAPGVLDVMASGRLDGYRAGIVCEELRDAPLSVCREVVTRIEGSLGSEPAAALRRRVRRALGAVDAELVRAKAARARSARSLRRWPGDEPGVDTWVGSFPVEQARSGWAVVDRLARQYVQEGRATGVDQARADALMDLIHSRATGTFVVQLAVPAADTAALSAADAAGPAERRPAAAPSHRAAAPARALAARATPAAARSARPAEVDEAEALVTVAGLGMSGATQVRRAWLNGLTDGSTTVGTTDGTTEAGTTAATVGARTTRSEVVACHADTGALLAVESRADTRRTGASATAAYRPPPRLVELVKARDGRCRFPGCTVSAVFCDLDHVRPWPSGPTDPSNLMCLCRRHHRIKQTVRWRVRIDPDATVTWTDPTGRLRTTLPIDFLHGAQEQPALEDQRPHAADRSEFEVPPSVVDEVGILWSAWEDELTHHLATAERDRADRRRAERARRAERGRRPINRHPPYRPALTWVPISVGTGTQLLDRPPPVGGSRSSPRRRWAEARADEPPPF